MRKLSMPALAGICLLSACGGANAIGNAEAQDTRKAATPKPQETWTAATGPGRWDSGGAVNCYDPSISRQAASVAERSGAKPCADASPSPTPSANAEDEAVRWQNPQERPETVGLLGADDMEFRDFYARCDPAAKTVWLTRLGLARKPRDPTLHFLIDGQRFDVPGTVEEDEFFGNITLLADTYYGAPVLDALGHAKTVRITVDRLAVDLPVTSLRTAWLAFRVHCGFAPNAG